MTEEREDIEEKRWDRSIDRKYPKFWSQVDAKPKLCTVFVCCKTSRFTASHQSTELTQYKVSWRRGPVRLSPWTGTAASREGPSPDRRPAVPAGRDRSLARHEPDPPAWTSVSCGVDSGVKCLRVWTMKVVISWSISRAGPARNQEAESRPPRSPDSGGEDRRSPERDWLPLSIAYHRQAEHLPPLLLATQSSATIRAEGRGGGIVTSCVMLERPVALPA